MFGKHYVKMGQTSSLSNEVYIDVAKSHVVFLAGKRGSGKSYSLAVLAEGIADLPADISKNIAVLILDTMGIFWTMKYPNQKDRDLLTQWGMQPKGLDVEIYAPIGVYQDMVDNGIPADKPFAIEPEQLEPAQWTQVFGLDPTSETGALLEETAAELCERGSFQLADMDKALEAADASAYAKRSAQNLVRAAHRWGLFGETTTPISELIKPGQVTILDVSTYATQEGSWDVRGLVIGLVAQRLFEDRMQARRKEEHEALEAELAFQPQGQRDEPIIWLLIDEAHEFLPNVGETPAMKSLITILREGRQPGISLVLASQQPGKIHTDVMTQSDVIISHRITAKIDTDALGTLTQSYMRDDLDVLLNELPHMKGAAIVLDDNNEKLYSIQVRPRFSWHGGDDPDALRSHSSL